MSYFSTLENSFSLDSENCLYNFDDHLNFGEIPIINLENESSNNVEQNSSNIKNIADKSNINVNKTRDNFIGKRGRKIEKNKNKKPRKEHTKLDRDNIRVKINCHFLKFLINLINIIIQGIINEKENINEYQFLPLNYKLSQLNKSSLRSLKKTSLKDIITSNTSPKLKKNQNNNLDIYNKIVSKSAVVEKILNKVYLYFFKIYHSNTKKIDLSEFGLNKTIDLSFNFTFYEDLIKEIQNTHIKIK